MSIGELKQAEIPLPSIKTPYPVGDGIEERFVGIEGKVGVIYRWRSYRDRETEVVVDRSLMTNEENNNNDIQSLPGHLAR